MVRKTAGLLCSNPWLYILSDFPFHVKYDGFYYSVPYTYFKQPVEIHAYPRRIEVFNAEISQSIQGIYGIRR